MNDVLLLVEGDRTCEECRGKGVAPEDSEDQYGNTWEIEVACEWCEDGKITERQNPTKPIDLKWWNEFGRDVILAERFRGAITRRNCDGRGVLSQRHLLGPCRGGTVEMPTTLPSGSVILLPLSI